MATKLSSVKSIPAYAVIIRCIHERGPTQEEALDELARRRLWLSEDQVLQAQVSRERAGLGHLPTRAQYEKYRAQRRIDVRRIVSCIHSATISLTPWALDVLRRARQDHSASIRRQQLFGCQNAGK